MTFEDELTQFRLSLVKYFKTNIRVKKVWPRGRANIRKNIQKELKQLKVGGVYKTYYERGKLCGYISLRTGGTMGALSKDASRKTMRLWVNPTSKFAMRWARNQISDFSSQWGPRFDCVIDYWCEPLLKDFERHGVFLSCVIIDGHVKRSLKQLEQNYPNLRDQQEKFPYQFRPMRSKKDIEASLEIMRKEFSRNPQFGWFVTHPSFLKMIRKEMRDGMKDPLEPHDWVIEKNGKVVGQFGYTVANAFDGKTKMASFGLNFSKAVQGKGLAKHAYQILLTELKKQKFVFFIGGTAQPGIMKLGKLMGRRCYALELVKVNKRPFPRDYFKDWLQF